MKKRHSLSLIEVESAFGTEAQCSAYIAAARWPEGVQCLKCESDKVSAFISNETEREITNRKGETKTVRVPARHLYQCNNEGCRHQFSATANTVFADTHLPLSTWFKAIALLANAKKSMSALQMSRDLNVNYRTAWHLNHRIREAMLSEEGLFGGTVEVDATFHGGKFDKRRKRAAYDKQAVAGVLQRDNESGHSKVKAFLVEKEIVKVMAAVIKANVAADSILMTDDHGAYRGLGKIGWKHEIVKHSVDEWVNGTCHTQGIDGFWSLFKRQINGQHHWVSVKHLHRYLSECAFKFNNREAENIFAMIVVNLIAGVPLRFGVLTAPVSPSSDPDQAD